jgi:hypothetical protein
MNALLRALRSFGQGASNAVASNVSFPVDAIAWALRKGGLPIPQNPVGGSDWMAQQGLTATPQNRIAGLLGETAGMVGPAVVQAAAPKIASGLLALDDKAMDMARRGVENYMDSTGIRQNMLLYHGTDSRKLIDEILPRSQTGSVANGLFASGSKQSAGSHGGNLYEMDIPDNLIHGSGSMAGAINEAGAKGRSAYAELLRRVGGDEKLARAVIDDAGLAQLLPNADKVGGDAYEAAANSLLGKISNSSNHGTPSESLSWDLQNQRGLLAKDLGFKAVAMNDEHGVSYLIPSGSGVKPIPHNDRAKAVASGAIDDLDVAEKSAVDFQRQANQKWAADYAEKGKALVAEKMDAINKLPDDLRQKAALLMSRSRTGDRRASLELRRILERNGAPIK